MYKRKLRKISTEHDIDKSKFNYASLKMNNEIKAICAIENRIPQGGRARDASLFLANNSDGIHHLLMLGYISQKTVSDVQMVSAVNLSVYGRRQYVENTLEEHGYHKATGSTHRKICAGPVISEQNWLQKKSTIEHIASISLPDVLPNYDGFNQQISFERGHGAPLNALENFYQLL